MDFDPAKLSTSAVYALMIRAITPRPIAWISTQSPTGQLNLAPFSYFAGVGSNPPTVMVSIANRPSGDKKDTLRNIEATGEFVVNIVPTQLAQAMVRTADELPYGESEFVHAGLATAPSQLVRPPRVASAPIQLECRALEIVRIGQGGSAANAVFGQIVWFHVADEVLTADHKIDPALVDSVGRMGGLSYCHTRERFELK
jgi:flavin reductase (DIM6/NTAB) family NADH-FMN oxidoreductase RutF